MADIRRLEDETREELDRVRREKINSFPLFFEWNFFVARSVSRTLEYQETIELFPSIMRSF